MKRSLSPLKAKVKATSAPKAAKLLAWYDRHRRIMPWRALPGVAIDPYRVWLSEIMLQQTTVAAVAPYFQKFIKRWPTVQDLANAERDEVMQMWAGLGYYRRAHMLYDCARRICNDYGGAFPDTESELLALPGFGPYTAAAVGAIAFDRRANVVDGNVERVMARIFAIRDPLPQAKGKLRAAAATLLPKSRYGDYAQALMDLGATICTPRNPKCDLCPWNNGCMACALGIQETLPRRAKTKAKLVRRAIAFVAINKKNEILLRKRPAKGLLGGMMEVPSSAWVEQTMPVLSKTQKEAPLKGRWRLLEGKVKHVFSHFELELGVAVSAVEGKQPGHWTRLDDVADEALPSVMRKIIRFAVDHI